MINWKVFISIYISTLPWQLSISLFYKGSNTVYREAAQKDSQTYIFRSKLGICGVSEPKLFVPHSTENFQVEKGVESWLFLYKL